jgi:hypothetical protein
MQMPDHYHECWEGPIRGLRLPLACLEPLSMALAQIDETFLDEGSSKHRDRLCH